MMSITEEAKRRRKMKLSERSVGRSQRQQDRSKVNIRRCWALWFCNNGTIGLKD
ncbi:unnamed protein product [Arabidopsis lyrata]|nr:unnamed protein product [Arabidopsis lyrata]